MKVVHIGTADNSGGAARAAFQLHEGLLRAGHQSSMLVGQKTEARSEIARIGFPHTLPGKLCQHGLGKIETWTGLQYLLQPHGARFLTHPFVVGSDIVHLHNLHGSFFPFTILPQLSERAPLVWTLHDTWALTGHCSYNYDCDRWRVGCGHCPNLDEYPRLSIDTTGYLWRRKRESYRDARPTVVAPSQWLTTMAKASPLFESSEIICIPYGIDLDVFHPGGGPEAREALSIPRDARVVMIVAFDEAIDGAARKGAKVFKEALELLSLGARPWILAVGSRGVFEAFRDRFHIRETGYLASPRQMRDCYAAADVFVLPTLADNLPVSLIEAAATGTPSVAFDVGGVRDVLRHRETGYLAAYKDSHDLARGIDWILLEESRRPALRQACREAAERDYSIGLMTCRYTKVYETVWLTDKRHKEGREHAKASH